MIAHLTLDQKKQWSVTLEGAIFVFRTISKCHLMYSCVKFMNVSHAPRCVSLADCDCGWVSSSLVLTMSSFVTGMTLTTASVTRATAATPGGSVTRRGSARGWLNARTGHATAEVNSQTSRQTYVILSRRKHV